MAAGPFTGPDNNQTPQFRSDNRDFLQPNNPLSSRFLRARGANRHRLAGFRDFPAAPPSDSAAAIATLISSAEVDSGLASNEPQSGPFRFERHSGAVVREIPRGYYSMCDSLSCHIWSRPDGKRVCFDTRGKPGIAIRIPIN